MWELFVGALRVVLTGVLVLYLAVTLVAVLVGARVALTHEPRLDRDNPELDAAFRRLVPRPRHRTVMGLLFAFGSQPAWPVLVQLSRPQLRRPGDQRLRLPIAATAPHRWVAGAVLGFVGVMGLLWNTHLSYRPVLIFSCAAALGSIICRQISYVIVPLNQQQRRSGDAPWLAFLLVAILDAAALSVVVADLRALTQEVRIDATLLERAVVDLFDVPRHLLTLLDLEPGRLLLACAGFLYAAGLIRSILAPSQFRRTDDDYRSMAFTSAAGGDAVRALRWLGEEQQSDASSDRIRTQIGLVSGDLDSAYLAAGDLLARAGASDTPDRRLGTIVDVSPMAPMEDETTLALGRLIVERGTGFCVAALLPSLVTQHPGALPGLRDLLDRSRHPMAFALMLELAGELEQAERVLEALSPGSDAEALLRLAHLQVLRLLIAGVDLEVLAGDLSTWSTALIPELARLAEGVDEAERRPILTALVQLEFSVELVALQGGDASSFSMLRHDLRRVSLALADTPEAPEILIGALRGATNRALG